jgi:O-6-methylguanine DNA methyltransferase
MKEELSFTFYDSPAGRIGMAATKQGLTALDFVGGLTTESYLGDLLKRYPNYRLIKDGEYVNLALMQIKEYFSRQRKQFSCPLDIQGTPFQLKVWKALQDIPFGHTVSYEDIARKIGNIKAVRAVGQANGKNPIAIIIPCHRVIRKSGNLGGYSSGLEIKKILLDWEQNF